MAIDKNSWFGRAVENQSTPSGISGKYEVAEFAADVVVPVLAGGLASEVGNFAGKLAPSLGRLAYAAGILVAAYALFSLRRRWADLAAAAMLGSEEQAIKGIFSGVKEWFSGKKPANGSQRANDLRDVGRFLANDLTAEKQAMLADMMYNELRKTGGATPNDDADIEAHKTQIRNALGVVANDLSRMAS